VLTLQCGCNCYQLQLTELAARQIPRPHLDLSTKEVLVMEYFQGKKLYDAIKEYAEVHAAAQGKTFKDLGMRYMMYCALSYTDTTRMQSRCVTFCSPYCIALRDGNMKNITARR
jgi:hypothetical protein